MTVHTFTGGCGCGNVTFEMELTEAPGAYEPRACDCDFCSKHGASYVSDPKGRLVFRVNSEADLTRQKQGSDIADFLVCRKCGVLVGVCYEEGGRMYAAVNNKAVRERASFGAAKTVSPKRLSDGEKTRRWKALWFADVQFK